MSKLDKMVLTQQGRHAGRSLIERIELQMDKRRKAMEDILVESKHVAPLNDPEYIINKGRYEGLAASLALLRSSSVLHEIERSNERLGIA